MSKIGRHRDLPRPPTPFQEDLRTIYGFDLNNEQKSINKHLKEYLKSDTLTPNPSLLNAINMSAMINFAISHRSEQTMRLIITRVCPPVSLPRLFALLTQYSQAFFPDSTDTKLPSHVRFPNTLLMLIWDYIKYYTNYTFKDFAMKMSFDTSALHIHCHPTLTHSLTPSNVECAILQSPFLCDWSLVYPKENRACYICSGLVHHNDTFIGSLRTATLFPCCNIATHVACCKIPVAPDYIPCPSCCMLTWELDYTLPLHWNKSELNATCPFGIPQFPPHHRTSSYSTATASATPIYESIENLDNIRIPLSDSLRDDTSIENVSLSSDSDSISISSSISSSDSTDSLPYHSNITTNHLAIVFPRKQAPYIPDMRPFPKSFVTTGLHLTDFQPHRISFPVTNSNKYLQNPRLVTEEFQTIWLVYLANNSLFRHRWHKFYTEHHARLSTYTNEFIQSLLRQSTPQVPFTPNVAPTDPCSYSRIFHF